MWLQSTNYKFKLQINYKYIKKYNVVLCMIPTCYTWYIGRIDGFCIGNLFPSTNMLRVTH